MNHAEETRNVFDKPAVSLQDEAEIKRIKLCLTEPIGCVISETKVSQSRFCRHREPENIVFKYRFVSWNINQQSVSPSLHISI